MASAPTPYVARSPDDLIALVPYLLGFHPEESLVMLTFGAGDGSFHARVDLPTDEVGRGEVVEVLLHALRANRVPRAAVVVFTGRTGDAAAMIERLAPALAVARVDLVDAVRADGACWWSLLGDDPRCGHPYDLSAHRFTADRVFEGQVALDSRADVAAGIRHPGTPPADRDTAAIAVAADRWVAQLVRDAGRVDRLRSHAAWLADRLGTWVGEGPVAADDAA
ncbi:MAG: hypothetical protein JWO46_200, partial [Nocardioidaceae bacterium]|nr:hypothetical protein [Nocardioidaceae bacterium]